MYTTLTHKNTAANNMYRQLRIHRKDSRTTFTFSFSLIEVIEFMNLWLQWKQCRHVIDKILCVTKDKIEYIHGPI